MSKKNNDLIELPDLNGFVTWDRLEDALRGIRESLEKSSNDAAAALASTRGNRSPVQVVERQSQTVSYRSSHSNPTNFSPLLVSQTKSIWRLIAILSF